MTKVMCAHALVPRWLGLARDEVAVHKAHAPESPLCWNILLDEVMAPVRQKWQREGRGYLRSCRWGMQAEDVGPCGAQVCYPKYADDIILVAASPTDIHNMCSDLEGACSLKGIRVQSGRVRLWRLSGHIQFSPAASM